MKIQNNIVAWSSYCITIWGWRKALLALLLGALSVLALPPINLPFILIFTMPSLIWLLDGAYNTSLKKQNDNKYGFISKVFKNISSARPAFWVGIHFAFGYFFVGLFWIGEAFLVEAERVVYLLPFAITLMPLLLSIFWGLACLVARIFWTTSPIKNVIIFTFSLTFFEILRGNIFTGFPWNLLGFAFDFSTAMLQSAAIWGIYGLTFIVILLSTGFAIFADARYKPRSVFMVLFTGFLVLWVGGSARLYYSPTQYNDKIYLRLVQGNIAQKDKWRPEMREAIANRYLELSAKKTTDKDEGLNKITHLIWPEAAMPFLLRPESSFMREAISLLKQDAFLITGAIDKQNIDGNITYFNSILVFNSSGNRVGKYNKHHLVPFGEYLPYAKLLKKIGLEKMVSVNEDISKGKKPTNIYLKNTPAFAASICYEAIFSGRIVEKENRPEWILNLTNDAWFGETIGPYQHLAQARMRAIEEGLPMVRVANTGLTAVFDPMGRKVASLPKGKTDILDTRLPLKVGPTIFVMLSKIY